MDGIMILSNIFFKWRQVVSILYCVSKLVCLLKNSVSTFNPNWHFQEESIDTSKQINTYCMLQKGLILTFSKG